jgi:Ca2+-transporting ATPase
VFLQIPFLTAIMILWINLVTDSLPALALWTEKAEKDVMNTPPRKSGNSLFSGKIWKNIFTQWIMQTILTLASFGIWTYVLIGANHEAKAITMAFITLSLIQLFHSYNLRSQKSSLLSSNPFSNKFLNLSFLIWIILIWTIVLIPVVQNFFGITALESKEYIIAILCAFLIIPFVEIQKMVERRK